MFARMKHIDRWALMRNTRRENLSEHSADVAAIAHAVALLKNTRFGGSVNAERAAFLGLYHDMPEIITGDMPTPVKYHSDALHDAFLQVEREACDRLLSMLPEDLRQSYRAAFFHEEEDAYLWRIVKAADKIAALIKCIEEEQAGNREFRQALAATKRNIEKLELPEAEAFLDEFLGGFYLSLDEQQSV
jgi:5'-deoxynucleotidase